MVFFRMGAIVLILTSGIHLIGHFQDLTPGEDLQSQLLELMTKVKIAVSSDTSITMMGLQKGFSLCFSLLFLWTGVMALFLSIRLHVETRLLRSISLIYVVMLSIGTAISYAYFFYAPTTLFTISLVLFATSYYRLRTA